MALEALDMNSLTRRLLLGRAAWRLLTTPVTGHTEYYLSSVRYYRLKALTKMTWNYSRNVE